MACVGRNDLGNKEGHLRKKQTYSICLKRDLFHFTHSFRLAFVASTLLSLSTLGGIFKGKCKAVIKYSTKFELKYL